jgi:hypothetical protein
LSELDIAAGDLDYDGREEVAVSAGGWLIVFDDALAAFAEIPSDEPTLRYADRVDIGDVTGDGQLDVVAVQHGDPASWAVHSLAENVSGVAVMTPVVGDVMETLVDDSQSPPVCYSMYFPDLAVDDVDGDGAAEIILVDPVAYFGGANSVRHTITSISFGSGIPALGRSLRTLYDARRGYGRCVGEASSLGFATSIGFRVCAEITGATAAVASYRFGRCPPPPTTPTHALRSVSLESASGLRVALGGSGPGG